MTKNTVKVLDVNCTTGEEILRDATADEIAQIEIDAANAEAKKSEVEAKAAEKQALLDRLGITADEAKLLLG